MAYDEEGVWTPDSEPDAVTELPVMSAQEIAAASQPQQLQDNELPVMSAQEIAAASQPQSLPVMSQAEIDKLTQTAKTPEAESQLGAFTRSAINAVPSTLGGLGGGAIAAGIGGTLGRLAGGAAGAVLGPAGTVAGWLGGGAAGGYLGEKAYSKAKELLGFDDDLQMAANRQAHKWTTAAGEAVPLVLGLSPGRGAQTAARLLSGGIGGVVEGGTQLAQGEFQPERLVTNIAAGVALPGNRNWLSRLEGAAARQVQPKPGSMRPVEGIPEAEPPAQGQFPWGAERQQELPLGEPVSRPPTEPTGQQQLPFGQVNREGQYELLPGAEPAPHGTAGAEAAAGVSEAQPPPPQTKAHGPEDYGKTTPVATGEASGVNVIKDGVDPTLAHTFKAEAPPAVEPPTAAPRPPPEAPPAPRNVGEQLRAQQAARVEAEAMPQGMGLLPQHEPIYRAAQRAAPELPPESLAQIARMASGPKQAAIMAERAVNRIAERRAAPEPVRPAETAVPEGTMELPPVEVRPAEPPTSIPERVGQADLTSDRPGFAPLAPEGTPTPESFWSYKPGSPTPTFEQLPPGLFKGTKAEWEAFSPGMRREIVRDAQRAREQPAAAETKPAAEKPPLYPHAALSKPKLEKALEKARTESSKITNELIAAGRGREKGQDIAKQTDELSQRYKANSDLVMSLADEMNRRMTWGGTLKPIPEAHRDSFYAAKKGQQFAPQELPSGAAPPRTTLEARPIEPTGRPVPEGARAEINTRLDQTMSAENPAAHLRETAAKAREFGLEGQARQIEQAAAELERQRTVDIAPGPGERSTGLLRQQAEGIVQRVRDFIKDEGGGVRLPRTPPAKPGSLEAAHEYMQTRIAPKSAWRDRLPGSWQEVKDIGNRLYAQFKSEFDPLEQLAKKDPNLKPEENFGTLARLTNGLRGRVMQSLGYEGKGEGTYDILTRKVNGASLKAILKPVENDLDKFTNYAMAKRAIELHGRNIETGIDIAKARQIAAAEATRFEPVLRELTGYQDRILDNLQRSGILSKDAVLRMRQLNKEFVPFYRMIDPKSDLGQHVGGGLKTWDPVHGIKGSERQLLDPIDSIVRNTYVFTAMAERNMANLALEKFALNNPKGAGLLKRVQGVHAVEVTTPELQKFMDDHNISEIVQDTMKIFRPNTFKPDANTIRIYNNGQARIYKVSDPAIAKAINAMDREQMGLFTKMMSYPASLLRAGAVLSPEFIARNPVRDQLSAFINSKHGYIPVYDMMRGAASLLEKGDLFQNMMIHGGFNATMVGMDRKLLSMDPKTLAGQVKNVITSPLEALRVVSEFMENATRMGEFRRAIEAGKSPTEAAFAAREVSLDFARNGAKGRAINSVVPFFNAQLEGIDRTARAFKDNPIGTLTKAGLSITAPSVALWYANKDDPRFKEIPQWEKDLFWHIITDRWKNISADDAAKIGPADKRQTADGQWQRNDGTIYRIPKPFEVGIIFGSLPERMLNYMYKQDPKAFQKFNDTMVKGLIPNLIPQALVPPLEQFANRSTFLSRPVVPKYMEDLPASKQVLSGTSEVAKKLGGLMSTVVGEKSSFASPVVLDNYVRGYGGSLGKHMTDLMDQALIRTGVADKAPQPSWTAADTPLLKAFASRFPTAGAQSIQDFYDIWDDRKSAKAEVVQAKRAGQTGDEMTELRRNAAALKAADPIHKQIGKLHQKIASTLDDKGMSPEQKRETIDTTYLKMIETARRGVENFQVRKQRKELEHASSQ